MKKLNFLFVSLIAVALLFSCEKEATYNDGMLKKGTIEAPCDPIGDLITVESSNPGGNITCDEVAETVGWESYYCTDKVDYDGDFEGSFPEGINVEVTGGRYIQFWLDDYKCIEINGTFYMVGAVIVKGGPTANVYYYENGAVSDCGLSAPVNQSGKPAGLSNLTFCLIPCDDYVPDYVIAFKSQTTDSDGYNAYTVIPNDEQNCDKLVDPYLFTEGIVGKVYLNGVMSIGNITVGNFDGDEQLEVKIDNEYMNGVLFTGESYLFVGTITEFCALSGPYYYNYDKITPISSPVSELIFDLPF
ncbi:MAG: hypothetical protein RQ743_13095 [Bacteroidales bacterium]|nr:hypothetical protein [Bacteroidales bacterium]